MNKYNWNYEELGFKSDAEMRESIARVERRKKMDSLELDIELLNERQKNIDAQGNIDLEAIEAGARLEHLDTVVQSKIYEAEQQAKLQAKQAEMQGLMRGLAERTENENKQEAERELEKAKAKADAELQKEIYS